MQLPDMSGRRSGGPMRLPDTSGRRSGGPMRLRSRIQLPTSSGGAGGREHPGYFRRVASRLVSALVQTLVLAFTATK